MSYSHTRSQAQASFPTQKMCEKSVNSLYLDRLSFYILPQLLQLVSSTYCLITAKLNAQSFLLLWLQPQSTEDQCLTCVCVWWRWRACRPSSWWWSCRSAGPDIPPPSSETTAAASPWPSCRRTDRSPGCLRSGQDSASGQWYRAKYTQSKGKRSYWDHIRIDKKPRQQPTTNYNLPYPVYTVYYY